jgi:3-hydroxybutyrate dehydrogenase
MRDRVAVVTGATSGIGQAVAEGLAAAGAAVVVAGRDAARGAAVVEKIAAAGGRAMFQPADVQRSEEVQRLMAAAQATYGRLDILVNDAGLQYVAPLVEFPEEKWQQLIGVILTGSFLCTKYALPAMMAGRWGRIINIASQLSRIGAPYKAAYVAAKHGLIGLTRVTALEGAPYNITANAICPSYVRTPLVDGQIANQAKAHGISEAQVIETIMLKEAAVKRLLEPAEVADFARFLCSDAAAGITGADLMMDCGATAH